MIHPLKINFRTFFFLLFSLTTFLQGIELEEKPMVIVVASYNNIDWYQKNLTSIFMQDYTNYRVIYIDDCSTDGTTEAVKQFILLNNCGSRIQYIVNQERQGAMANLYYAIHSCKNNEIIVTVDGDDWLYHQNVLKELNEVYSKGEVWFTHGTLMEYPWGHVSWCEPYPADIIARGAFREFKCPSHLRTFYTWLFKQIKKEDFMYNGKFLAMAWDMAIMYPLSEMAGERHAFIKEPNYVYNMHNPINDNKVDPDLQNVLDRYIRKKPPYNRLETSLLSLY